MILSTCCIVRALLCNKKKNSKNTQFLLFCNLMIKIVNNGYTIYWLETKWIA